MMSTQQKTDVNVIAVENNSYSNAALDDEGRVWTWGNSNVSFRLGRTSSIASNTVNPFNRGGQVTTTIYPGENLPFILQISGSYQSTLALDRDGSVWSWGREGNYALGRTGSNDFPGRVQFPAGVKIKWIAAAYDGGKAIDRDGNIWVWGYGIQDSLGTGNDTNVRYPVMLTQDSANNPLPKNFTKISSSDFSGRAAAMAVTEDGKIFTWGNDGNAGRGGASKPRQTGFNADIKKIDVGNGVFGFLTNSGEIWTWGDNIATDAGRQGHGDSVNRDAPKLIETVVNSGTKPAPKFRDFSIYAWSMCAVDYEGNIYGCGQNLNSKHTGTGSPNRLTKYLPNGLPTDTEIFIVAEGYTSTSYVDVYGNAYVTGESDARGNNHNDGSMPGPWVHFTGSGKPMFTVLSSSPTSEAKRYNTTPRTTLNAETNIACDEVKYVIIYPEDTDAFTDGERFYDKSFAEFEQPYYLKGTDPQLLLSPYYDLWSSRYYANPKISEEVFEAAYSKKSTPEKGTMDVVTGSGSKVFLKPELVSHNCIVWVQSRNSKGTTRAIYRFDNYYTQTKVWHEGIKNDDQAFTLYQPELVGGGYGLFLDRQGNLIPGDPPFGYDNVMPTPKAMDFWSLSPSDQLDEETLEDGYTHRVDRSKEVFLTELSQKGDDTSKTPRVTFTYEKNPLMWVDANLYFVNERGIPELVLIEGEAVTEDHKTKFAPKGAAHVEGQDPYLPPEAVNTLSKAAGYSIGTRPDDTPGCYIECDFPNGFKPVLEGITDIYIVYLSGMISATETFIDVTDGGDVAIKNNDGLYSSAKNLRQGIDKYDFPGPAINGYVIVGHEITVGSEYKGRTDYPWIDGRYDPGNALIPVIEDNAEVRFLYKLDSNGNNIPDDEEGCVQARWIAVNANNVSFLITEKTISGNAAQGESATILEDKVNVLPTALYNPPQWLFRPGDPGDTAPYFPVGSGETAIVPLVARETQIVYFYYNEDYNENAIADKDEGYFTEKYKFALTDGDLTPPKADTASKWLGGQTYSKQAPLIAGYVATGFMIEAGGNDLGSIPRVDRELTGNVTVVYEIPLCCAVKDYTVTFLYKEDKNNNNIPDDEEGRVTIKWVGTTFAGNTVELMQLVLEGYIGDDVTDKIAPPDTIDSVWKLVSSDVPGHVVLPEGERTYTYQYTEVLEFSTITIESKSTDDSFSFMYQYTKRITDETFDVTAFVIPTYRVTRYVLYDGYGNEIGDGTGDTVRLDPSTGSRRVLFIYESTITTVVVRAVEADDSSNILQSQTITDAVIGQKYAAAAPYLDDSWVLTSDVLQVIDVAGGTNYITFEYEKATGNVTVLLKETDALGRIIRVLSEDVTYGTSRPIIIPELDDAYYTKLSVTPQVVDHTGAEPVPQLVEYYYAKEMMDVIIKAVDEADGSELKSVTYTAAARRGEAYLAVAPSVEWYSIAESVSKSVYADPDAAGGAVVVPFLYKKDNVGTITVRSFYKDGGGAEVDLESYTAKALLGSKFTALAGSFPGFELLAGEAVTIELIVDADDSKNSVAFEYTDLRKTVGVYTQIGEDEDTKQQISANKYVNGSEVTIIPPYMKNHLVMGYIIDTDEMTEVDPETFTSLHLKDDTAITSDMSIVFVYAPIEEIVEERFHDVTVTGVTNAITHYSHTKRIAKADLPLTLAYPADVFDVPGHVLDSEADFEVTEDTDEKLFDYYSLATTVTIRMVDETGTDVADSFAVGATAGSPFTYNAPNVPDHYLTGSSLGVVSPVLTGGTSVIVFTYARITSNVTIIAREDGANGRVIGVFEVPDPQEGTAMYDVPDLSGDYYSENQPTVEITYDGTNSVSVEAYYTKELVTVPIEAVHYLTGTGLGSQAPLENQRKGEAVTVSAPSIANHTVVGSVVQIVIADGVTVAVFKYRPSENDEVVVKAVDANGSLLQSYVLKGVISETISIDPPTILGWKTSDAAKSAVIGTDSEVVFSYTKNVVTVTVNTVDGDGAALGSTLIEVAKGGSYTAYAPHIAGYVIDGAVSYALTNLAADETVIFVYKPVEAAVVTVTVIGKCADSELYRYNIVRAKNSGRLDVDASAVAKYSLISATPATVDVGAEDETVIFEYEGVGTTVTVYMINEGTSERLAVFFCNAQTGGSFTYNAPRIAMYNLTGASVGTVSPVLPNGASKITFTYREK